MLIYDDQSNIFHHCKLNAAWCKNGWEVMRKLFKPIKAPIKKQIVCKRTCFTKVKDNNTVYQKKNPPGSILNLLRYTVSLQTIFACPQGNAFLFSYREPSFLPFHGYCP